RTETEGVREEAREGSEGVAVDGAKLAEVGGGGVAREEEGEKGRSGKSALERVVVEMEVEESEMVMGESEMVMEESEVVVDMSAVEGVGGVEVRSGGEEEDEEEEQEEEEEERKRRKQSAKNGHGS
ncbi:hypothetical protein INR49_009024, partial [Caranx melampygus]